MIEPHGEMKEPSHDSVLWRFMDFTKYVALLDTGQLIHSSQENGGQLRGTGAENDHRPLAKGNRRTSSSEDEKEEIRKRSGNLLSSMSSMVREEIDLSCWHQNPHESAAMWKLYFSSGEGIAIRTTFAALKRAFQETEDQVFAAVVNNIDYAIKSFRMNNAFIPILHKRKSFSHEAEVRLIWWALSLANRPSHNSLPNVPLAYSPGHAVSVSLTELVQEVFVSPTAGSWLRDLVESVTRKYGLSCAVHKSNPYSDPVW